MIRGTSMFSQLVALFPRLEFEQAVQRHQAERYTKGFRCWDQFVAMLFCQLGQAKSLREICKGLRCCLGKLQHLGILSAPPRSTLCYANGHRPWQLYQTVFHQLLEKCQTLRLERSGKKFRFRQKLCSLDSTVIELSLSLFDWAKFQRTKGAVKLHLLLDHQGYLPTYAVVTDGHHSDVEMARGLELPRDSMVVMDRGYQDYELFGKWTKRRVWFVTRLRANALYEVEEQRKVPQNRGILRDEVIRLTGRKAQERCPYPLRRVVAVDRKTQDTYVFLTNHPTLGASTVAAVYKDRWQIELFFKALKQNLRIKTFLGTTANAVHIQIWTALIAMLLLKYLQFSSRIHWALSNLIALLRWNLFTYRDIWRWIDNPFETLPNPPPPEQLCLWSPPLGQHP